MRRLLLWIPLGWVTGWERECACCALHPGPSPRQTPPPSTHALSSPGGRPRDPCTTTLSHLLKTWTARDQLPLKASCLMRHPSSCILGVCHLCLQALAYACGMICEEWSGLRSIEGRLYEDVPGTRSFQPGPCTRCFCQMALSDTIILAPNYRYSLKYQQPCSPSDCIAQETGEAEVSCLGGL